MPQGERADPIVVEYRDELRRVWADMARRPLGAPPPPPPNPQRQRDIDELQPLPDPFADDDPVEDAQPAPRVRLAGGRPFNPDLLAGLSSKTTRKKPVKVKFKPITDCDCECASECEFEGDEAQICFDTKE